MNVNPPVTDWVHDFDHTDPQWTEDPYPIWDKLRAASPIVHTDRYLGVYMPTTYEAVREISHDTEHFSSRRIIVRTERPEIVAPAPPITSDPPFHKPAKQLMLPPFTPDAVKKLEPRSRAICNELIDGLIKEKRVDAAAQYAKYIPVRVIAHMLGIPETDADLFIRWIHEILELGIHDPQMLQKAAIEMREYFQVHIEERKKKPTDDLITVMMNARTKDGQPLSDEHVMGSLRLLLIAGIDTTWSAIGASMWHLAKTPDDRKRLVAEPETDADRDRGILARLFAGHDGARSGEGNHGLGLPGQDRQHGAAVVPGREPRPRDVPRCRQGRSSTARRTATPRSASASTAASARTSRGWKSRSRWKNG